LVKEEKSGVEIMQWRILLIIIFSVLISFLAVLNQQDVTINLIFSKINISLILVIFLSLFIGAAIMFLFSSFKQLQLHKELRTLKKELTEIKKDKAELAKEMESEKQIISDLKNDCQEAKNELKNIENKVKEEMLKDHNLLNKTNNLIH